MPPKKNKIENPYIKIPEHEFSRKKLNPIFRDIFKCPRGTIYFGNLESYNAFYSSSKDGEQYEIPCPGICGGRVNITIAGKIN